MCHFLRRLLLCLVVLAFAGARPAAADTLATIKERGTLIVGTKADYKPYGFRDPSGAIIGLEPDLAADVARRLGVKLELLPVQASNRMQFLQQGRIDLMIATMTDRPDRRKVVGIPEPNYYSSGTNVLAKSSAGLEQWDALRGRNICGIQGSFYNKKTSRDFGANILAFRGTAEALTALKAGRCVGFVYDESFIVSKLREEQWDGYEAALPTIDDEPWGVGVPPGDTAFLAYMSEVIQDWHKSGLILELERKWGIQPNTSFAQRMHDQYK